jgi:hypothetical protein
MSAGQFRPDARPHRRRDGVDGMRAASRGETESVERCAHGTTQAAPLGTFGLGHG